MGKDREAMALDLLAFKMERRLAENYNTLLLSDINEVLFLARRSVIDPKSKKELEVINV